MGSAEASTKPTELFQNVVVMRHGDRLDNSDPAWINTAARPWDPPLNDSGRDRAFATGRSIRSQLGFPIHRVFVSPFLRCLETANGVVAGLLTVTDERGDSVDAVIGPSKIKVSVEYGLCEMLNHIAIRRNVAPNDGKFSFDISKCESTLSAGTLDHSVERVYEELPKWEEPVGGARARYLNVIGSLADKYPSQNLLLVTHGEGVGCAVSKFVEDVDMVCEVDYCAYSHLRRPIYIDENESFKAGDFVGLPEGLVGLKYILLNKESYDFEENYK
ncbi:hypothetical protein F511_15362 [Dorcoceras hygrometricum]|uniref:Phosphoglycerate mutase family protein n=1 Tax=Dorcoceras hygrometricum TaxID=472368 RepID=A0A2Z7CAX5_9LAMI|nr:hypothetical protein F511_15362 [Dorcoceras hygrometricum]